MGGLGRIRGVKRSDVSAAHGLFVVCFSLALSGDTNDAMEGESLISQLGNFLLQTACLTTQRGNLVRGGQERKCLLPLWIHMAMSGGYMQ